MPRRMRLPVLFLLLAVVGAATWFNRDWQPSRPAPPVDGKVVAVIDGDTIGVMIDGKEVRVRLHGIDAPEGKQPFGDVAKRELSARVFGRVAGVQTLDRDRYGRTVARIFVDGSDVNVAMVRAGFAWWYREYARDDHELSAAEDEARTARRGLWSGAEPVPPWEWRRREQRA